MDKNLIKKRFSNNFTTYNENAVVQKTVIKNLTKLIPFKQYKNGVACYPNEAQDLDLHYVGVTRAKKLCVLVSNSTRHNSKGEAKKGEPSIFLSRNGVEALRNNYYY